MNRQLQGREISAVAYYVTVTIGPHSFEALVDTGSSVTMISGVVYNKIKNCSQPLIPNNNCSEIQGIVAGHTLKILGTVSVSLGINEFYSNAHKLVVVEQASQPFILGLDFVDKYRISVDTKDRMLIIENPERTYGIPMKAVCILDSGEKTVVSCNHLTIPPRSGIDIDVKVRNMSGSLDGCIEQGLNSCPEIIIARSINTVINGNTKVRALNMNSYPVTLVKNQNLATFIPVERADTVQHAAVHVSGTENREHAFDLDHTDLSEKQKEGVFEMLSRYDHIMGSNEYDMGCTGTIKHTIDVQGSPPIKQTYRRFPQPLKREIDEEIAKLLEKGIIEPSFSPWAAPLVPVRKKSGVLRLCIDFRALNAVTRKDSFPLPNLADAVGQFIDNKYFSSLDLLAGYHQIEMDKGSVEVTAFSTGDNLYQFKRMPFGVTNGPATFSRLVSIVLSGVPINVAQAYLDDIIVAGKSFEDHLANLECVFSRLSEHGLKLNVEKCEFFKHEVSYLGHVVSTDGIKPMHSNVQAILEFPKPDNIKKLRTFNGMVNFYKKFIKGSEDIMRPLYRATSAKTLQWTDDCDRSFEKAKAALVSIPILAYPDFASEAPFCITTDASGFGAGAVLTQTQGGVEKVIGYAGTSFNKAQLRYSPTDRELAAIRFAVNHFKQFLYGRHYVIKTDHQPLVYLHHLKRFDDRLHRTLEDLNIGHYELQYLPGRNNVVADALSRAEYPWDLPVEEEYPIRQESEASINDFDIVRVNGGANSLFDSMSLSLFDDVSRSLEIREVTVKKLLQRPEQYGYAKGAEGSRKIKVLQQDHTFPPFNVLQGVADSFDVTIVVHFVAGPVIRVTNGKASKTVNLLCSDGVHFDFLKPKVEVEPTICVPVQVENTNVIIEKEDDPSEIVQVTCSIDVEEKLSLASGSEMVKNAQLRDEVLTNLKELVNAGRRPKKKTPLAIFRKCFSNLSINSEDLLVSKKSDSPNETIPVVPAKFLETLASELHEVASHAGKNKVIKIMTSKFFHPHMSRAIVEIVRNCQVCQFHKGNPVNKFPLLKRNPEKPLDLYAVDLMDMPTSKRGYKSLLVGIDLKTKYGHAVPIKSKRSEAVSRAFESHVLATLPQHPRAVLSDNGPEFRGKPFVDLLNRYGIRHDRSVPYAAHTNGAVERLNRTIKEKLAIVSHGNNRRWDHYIHNIIAQYNRMPHSETGVPPAEFFLPDKAEIIIPTKIFWRSPRNFKGFEIGDLVLRKTPYQPAGQSNKLNPKFQGPLEIVDRDSNGVTYKAKWLSGSKKVIQLHVSQMKKYNGTAPVNGQRLVSPKRRTKTRPTCPVTSPNNIPCANPSGSINWEALRNFPLDDVEVEVSLLPTELDNQLGSWEMSPDASGIVSDDCVVHGLGDRSSPLDLGVLSDNCEVRESTPLPGTRRLRRLRSSAVSNFPAIQLDMEAGESSEDYFSGNLDESSELLSVMIDDQTRSEFRDECEGNSNNLYWSHYYHHFSVPVEEKPSAESMNDWDHECDDSMVEDDAESVNQFLKNWMDDDVWKRVDKLLVEVRANNNQAIELEIVDPNEYPCVLDKLKQNFVESCVNEDWCDKELNVPGYKDYNCMDGTVSGEAEGCTNCLPCTVV